VSFFNVLKQHDLTIACVLYFRLWNSWGTCIKINVNQTSPDKAVVLRGTTPLMHTARFFVDNIRHWSAHAVTAQVKEGNQQIDHLASPQITAIFIQWEKSQYHALPIRFALTTVSNNC